MKGRQNRLAKIVRPALAAVVLAAGGNGQLRAQDSAATSWSVQLDNDLFALWRSPRRRTDRDFSSGFMLALTRTLKPARTWERSLTLSLTQQIYTPSITHPRKVPLDRPYAAILSAGATLQLERPRTRHHFGAAVSVTGEPALGEPVQRLVHRLIGAPEPVGWEEQLPFEPALSLGYTGGQEFLALGGDAGLGWRMSVDWGMEVGTVASLVSSALRGTVGLNAPGTWRTEMAGEKTGGNVRIYIPYGLQLDVVGRTLVLDGTVFRDSPRLPRKTLVPRAEAGIAVEWHWASIAWIGHITGTEFQGQQAPHGYGSFRVVLR
ncbi:MAG TPA: lipid A deacylase LpxR family protein [Gemmatimonadales bacterium]|nr:lipid A deacylase LpxR family protein [Gemmatimonadales bacterium]